MRYLTRREALQTIPALVGATIIPAARAKAAERPPTPACEHDHPTPSDGGEPNYQLGSPLRTSLRESGLKGEPLLLTGTVMTTGCKPLAHAIVDFWQADLSGQYDFENYRLRGHQFTDHEGRFSLETITPIRYGPPPHIHVKVQPQYLPVFTTWLIFPDEKGFNIPELMVPTRVENGTRVAQFDFVMKTPF